MTTALNYFNDREFAPAKVNLFLEVTGRNDFGYHDLQSLVVFAGVGDLVIASPADNSNDVINIIGTFAPNLKDNADNIINKTLRICREKTVIPPLKITLQKELPVSAGIGGGSTDAAALLRIIERQFDLTLTEEDMIAIGADVPMCYLAKPCYISGVGKVSQAIEIEKLYLVLANPLAPVSTVEVFKMLQPKHYTSNILPKTQLGYFGVNDLVEHIRDRNNNLQQIASALVPQISRIITTMESTKPLICRMSGSGATCFALYDSEADAKKAEQIIKSQNPEYWVAYCTTLLSEPSSKALL